MSIVEEALKKLESMDVDHQKMVLAYIDHLSLDDDDENDEEFDAAKMSEAVLAKNWLSPEDEEAWKDL